MNKTLYRVWCEHDIGLEQMVFSSEEKAIETAANELIRHQLNFYTLQDEGLVGLEEVCYFE